MGIVLVRRRDARCAYREQDVGHRGDEFVRRTFDQPNVAIAVAPVDAQIGAFLPIERGQTLLQDCGTSLRNAIIGRSDREHAEPPHAWLLRPSHAWQGGANRKADKFPPPHRQPR
jgi:hypothetical protein